MSYHLLTGATGYVGGRLLPLLVEGGWRVRCLARQSKMPAVDLSKFEVDAKLAKLIPADIATKHLVLALKREGRTLTVAMADPTNLGVIEDLKFITRYDIFPVIAGEFTLKNVIEKHYESSDVQMKELLNEIEGLENPTAENIAAWIWHRLRPDLPGLALVRVAETPMSWAEYDGE